MNACQRRRPRVRPEAPRVRLVLAIEIGRSPSEPAVLGNFHSGDVGRSRKRKASRMTRVPTRARGGADVMVDLTKSSLTDRISSGLNV